MPFLQGGLFVALNAGTDLASDIESGFLNRLSLTPMAAPALLAGQLGGVLLIAVWQAIAYVLVGLAVGVGFQSGPLGILVLLALSLVTSFAFAAVGVGAGAVVGVRRGGPGRLPAHVRARVPELVVAAAQPDRDRLVPHGRDLQPGLVLDRGDPLADHHRLGWRGAGTRLRVGIVTSVVALTLASRMLRSRLGRGK